MSKHNSKLISLRGLLLAGAFAILVGCGGASDTSTPPPAGSPPSAPTNIAAVAGNASVALTWNASSGATLYNVKRALTSGGPYTQVASPASAAYNDASLVNGTAYYYVVSASNANGESGNSAQASATPVAPGSAPAAPTNLAATPGNATVALTWTASSGATGYKVKRSTTNGGPYTQIATPTAASYNDSGSLINGTNYYYVVSAVNGIGDSPDSSQVTGTPTAPVVASVTVTVTAANTRAISPYIYGVNNAFTAGVYPAGASGVPSHLTFDRFGGNRLTAYNWETNASNAGSDYFYQNDNLFPGSVPGSAVTDFITQDRSQGLATLFTVQMQGFVAGDTAGPVNPPTPFNASRFKSVVFAKPGASFSATPSTSDASVYMDEFVWAVNQKFPGQNIFGTNPSTKPVFVSLDNEPELWPYTHLEIQGSTAITSDAYIAKTISLSTALKAQFPNLVIFGPAHYGFAGIQSWQGELSGANWFTDKYLDAIKTASTLAGKPLVDVYDFHWYPEATDGSGNRVVNLNGTSLTDAQVQAIVQAPRSLWDTTYAENSWISNSSLGGPIYLLPRLQAKITAKNPGMKMAITEYNNGGAQHIAGTIAQADNLGIFGAQGLFAASLWPMVANEPYLLAGFRAFRNFDGASHHFGDTSVQTASSDASKVVVYVSTDTAQPGRVVMVAINRSTATQTTAVTGQPLSGTAHLFQMTSTTASGQTVVQPVAAGTQAVSGTSITLTLPALSVTTVDIY